MSTLADYAIDYFTKVLEDDLKAVTKPQYVDQIPKAVKGTNRSVGFQIKQRAQVDKERVREIVEELELEAVWDRDIDLLSGGELQRFAIAMVCVQQADVYVTAYRGSSSFANNFQLHVRRAVVLLGCQAASGRRSIDPQSSQPKYICHRG